MKNIFKNNSAIFKNAVGSVSDIFELKKVEEDVFFVEMKFLIGIIGQAQYETIIEQLYANETTEPYDRLLELLRPAVGRLVIVARIPEVSCSFDAGGILVKKTENTVPASEFKVKALLRSHRSKAYTMLDHALEYLEANTAVFTHYADSSQRANRINGIVITPDQFTQAFGQPVSHVIFFMIQIFIRKIENELLVNSIGLAFYQDLKTQAQNQATGVPIAEHFPQVLQLAQDAVTNLGMEMAIPHLGIKIDEDGISVLDNTTNYSAGNNRKAAPEKPLSALQLNCQKLGSASLKALTDYLNKTATAAIFPNYYNTSHYVDPDAIPEDWRTDMKGGYFGV